MSMCFATSSHCSLVRSAAVMSVAEKKCLKVAKVAFKLVSSFNSSGSINAATH